MISFVVVILLGSILLSLPISSANGERVPYLDALFTATTATCVTGLVTVTTASAWSTFGQAVILFLIQIGGLGVITIVSGFMIMANKRFGLKGSQLIQDAFNIEQLSGLVIFVKKVIMGTFLIEGIGAVLYMFVFIPQFGLRGIWISVFNAISAFCNAGMDIIGDTSLCEYTTNPMVNLVTGSLIVLGGIGFIVWWDVIRVIKRFSKEKFRCFKRLTLHSKLVISSSAFLLAAGMVLVLIFEYQNPSTLGTLSTFEKLQAALFQSVTTRTAGFAAIPQEHLTDASVLVCLILMFIGGSPVGTAGGVKTVTIVVLCMTAIATIRNEEEVSVFGRRLSKQVARKAIAVTGMSMMIMLTAAILLAAIMPDAALADILYEVVSATATVGLSRNLTACLPVLGKMLIIVVMYFGRVGPISLAIAFNVENQVHNIIKNPVEEVRVG